jgi:hypothetical protein
VSTTVFWEGVEEEVEVEVLTGRGGGRGKHPVTDGSRSTLTLEMGVFKETGEGNTDEEDGELVRAEVGEAGIRRAGKVGDDREGKEEEEGQYGGGVDESRGM